jgi:hypothetical protein
LVTFAEMIVGAPTSETPFSPRSSRERSYWAMALRVSAWSDLSAMEFPGGVAEDWQPNVRLHATRSTERMIKRMRMF